MAFPPTLGESCDFRCHPVVNDCCSYTPREQLLLSPVLLTAVLQPLLLQFYATPSFR